MTIAHWIVLLLFVAAFAAAVRHCLRHGGCSCNECAACKGGCGGCAGCRKADGASPSIHCKRNEDMGGLKP